MCTSPRREVEEGRKEGRKKGRERVKEKMEIGGRKRKRERHKKNGDMYVCIVYVEIQVGLPDNIAGSCSQNYHTEFGAKLLIRHNEFDLTYEVLFPPKYCYNIQHNCL